MKGNMLNFKNNFGIQNCIFDNIYLAQCSHQDKFKHTYVKIKLKMMELKNIFKY
jgi:hypothetical protein